MKKILFPVVLFFLLVSVMSVFPLHAGDSTIAVEKVMEKVERYIEVHSPSDVKAVFDFYIDLISAPISARGCKDGVFKGESIYDNYKYKHVVSLTIKNEKITAIEYDEVKKDGHGKRGDKKYCAEMKAGSGASPAEAYPVYENQFIKSQDLKLMDAISGATYSLYRFRTAVIRALLKAQN